MLNVKSLSFNRFLGLAILCSAGLSACSGASRYGNYSECSASCQNGAGQGYYDAAYYQMPMTTPQVNYTPQVSYAEPYIPPAPQIITNYETQTTSTVDHSNVQCPAQTTWQENGTCLLQEQSHHVTVHAPSEETGYHPVTPQKPSVYLPVRK